jgi:tetratricopeptide (TPR) repeat protein
MGRLRLVPVLLALCLGASAQPSDVLSPEYEAAIQAYLAGDRGGAVAMMVTWPEGRLRGEMRALAAARERARGALDPADIARWHRLPARGALMLHTDCALETRRVAASPGFHEEVAAEIARMLRDDAAHRAFARRWYGVMAGLAARENRWRDGLEWAERGRRDFPDSGEVLVAVASIQETSAVLDASAPEEAFLDPSARTASAARLRAREVRRQLESACRALRSALAADPSLAEARLRLGRVAWRLGQAAEARSALEELLSRQHAPAQAFLAHLFLGRVHEDAGRLDDAARSYAAALGLESHAQSARLALSHVRLRQGDAAMARAEAERALRAAGARRRSDPFWLYPLGPAAGVLDRLEALRREASS